ncbi:universal stress protein A-like protein [Tripterygium wilfordii]|uniref:Universal stress protein A-like protein n=1 Tax=Tripterygium wilfordii TaxID=458696 RepID=A0A7J7CUD6_TRIWF|nr:universal stress protein A-like protein [Tripterygium wilfordii]
MSNPRRVGVGLDYSPTSKQALRWSADNLIHGGDQLILIQVQPAKADHTRKQLFEDTGSPLVPLEEFREINYSKQYGLTHDPEVLDILDTVSRTKGVCTLYISINLYTYIVYECMILGVLICIEQAKVVAKVYWGDPREKLCDAVEDLKLDSLVLGSRGVGTIKRYELVYTHTNC